MCSKRRERRRRVLIESLDNSSGLEMRTSPQCLGNGASPFLTNTSPAKSWILKDHLALDKLPGVIHNYDH
jgi:hypothetical protein